VASVPAFLLYRIDDIELDPAKGSLRRDGQELHLKPKAFQILVYLVVQRDRLVSKEELLDEFWKDTVVGDDVLANSIAEIRRALGDTSRDSRYLRTVPKQGYRFVGDVQEVGYEALTATEQITTIQVREEYSDERSPRKYSRWIFAAAVLVLVVASSAALILWHDWPRPLPNAPEVGIRTAIIQFENRSGRPDMDWLSIGLPDMLATSLASSPRIALIAPQQLERGLQPHPTSRVPYKDALRDARQSGARAMIMGAFASLGDTVRLDTQIYDVPSGRLLGGESLTVPKPELLLAQLDSLATKVATRLGAPPVTQTRLAEVMTNNLEAYRLYSLGLARTRNLRLPEAIVLYQQALKLDPDFAMADARIGFTYSSSWGKPEEGKPYLEKAYRRSDRLTARDRLFIRAWYAVACKDYKSAEQAYREILSAFPLEVEAYYALGTLLSGDGRFDEARQIFERGLTIEPDMPQLHNMLSMSYLELGKNEKALASAQRYVSLSNEPNAYDTLAGIYQRIGHYDDARVNYLETVRRKPDFEIAIIHLGNLYFQLGRYREALEQYREYIRLAPSNNEQPRGHLSAAWVYWKKGDLAAAEREAAEAVHLNAGAKREALLFQAERGSLTLTDDLRRQILDFSTGAARGGRENHRIPLFIAGYVALRDHRTEEALQYFRGVVGETPISWYIDPLETCLADALLELGRLNEAIAEYRRVLRLNANYPMARYRLGLALERKGMTREAHAEFERFLMIWKDADPDLPVLMDAGRRYGSRSALSVLKR